MPRWRAIAIECLGVVSLLAVWYVLTAWVAPRHGGLTGLFFPTPDRIVAAFIREFANGEFLTVAGPTLWRFGLGFVLSTVLGVLSGLLLGAYPLALRAVDPVIGFFRSLPGVTLIPIITLFLGLGDASKVALVVSAAIWPIMINTIDGVRSVDHTMRETAEAYQLTWAQRLFLVLLPAAAPSISVGMRVAVSVGLVVTIISELIGASSGIGGFLVNSQASFAFADLWATLLLLGLLGYILNALFAWFDGHWLAWHHKANQPES